MRVFLLAGWMLLCLVPYACPRATAADDDAKHGLDPSANPRALTPAGVFVLDAATGKPAVGSLPVAFVRSPDHAGPGGAGRYLIVVNSGYGIQFNSRTNRGQQSIAVLDLLAKPAAVVQNVYFPSPQSANVGAVFSPLAADGTATLYVSGGFENKVWQFHFAPGASQLVTPVSPGPDTRVTARSIDLTALADGPAIPQYNDGQAAVYPTGLAVAGDRLFSADNLADNLGIIALAEAHPVLGHVDLRRRPHENVYPYAVAARLLPGPEAAATGAAKVYVSLWNASAVAVVEWPPRVPAQAPVFIGTGSHPSALLLAEAQHRLYVANSNDDSVSVIDLAAEREVERINVRLAESAQPGVSPEGLALSADGQTLYVANAAANAVAVVRLGNQARGADMPASAGSAVPSQLIGLIPTGRYPSALAVVGDTLFVGNGKGTGTQNSSNTVNLSGLNPNAPNADFPSTGKGKHEGRGGAYSVAVESGNILAIPLPDAPALAVFTAQVLQANGVTPAPPRQDLFAGRAGGSPIKHVIYIIKENRTYDQVFGDVTTSGDGSKADGDPDLAIFGSGPAARHPGGPAQNVTPNEHRLAQRFGLLDRFFVNSEASADGHNWSTAAFSTDYVDKVFRWNYSGRGRSYDFEGFNRLPDTGRTGGEPLFDADLSPGAMADFLRRYLPYTQGGKDAAEPATLYLWDLAARAHLTYRNYGEFVATESAADVAAARERRDKAYPDTSPNVVAIASKASLEDHLCPAARGFDLDTPDALTVGSYSAARAAADSPGRGARAAGFDPVITLVNPDPRFRGTSRLGAWLDEFARVQADLAAGKGDTLPALSILRFSNDHTSGLEAGVPTPQFDVADNDYAVGRLVEAVSASAFWRNTVIVTVEDDAQDGPDHVDCHRSVALVISAYNRPGALIHAFHTTAGLVRTMEQLLGLPPMNSQDAAAPPIEVFRAGPPDLTPYVATLPQLDPDALLNPLPEAAPDADTAAAIRQSANLNLVHADASDPGVLNAAIWLSVRGSASLPPVPAHLPAYDVLRAGQAATGSDEDED